MVIGILFHPDDYPNNNLKSNHVFPDEDFCLYIDFPFDQMIILGVFNSIVRDQIEYSPLSYTCTYIWFSKNLNYFWPILNFEDKQILGDYYDLEFKRITNQSLINSCKFEKKIQNCFKSNLNLNTKIDMYDISRIEERLIFFDYIFLIYLTPVVCLIGFFINILTAYLLSRKKTSKNLKEKHYDYFRANSYFSLVLFLIPILGLISECPHRNGIFCSQIRKYLFSQYYRKFFIDFGENFLKICINFTTLSFTITRMILVGKEHLKFFYFIF